MKPFIHPKDAGFVGLPTAIPRMVGKKAKPRAVRTPEERAERKQPEADVHTILEGEIEAAGLPYVSLREHLYGWLKAMVARGHDEAKELIDVLKDLPDLIVFDRAAVDSRCLLLELKRRDRQGRPGQKRLAAAAGGTIAQGYTEAHAALARFLTPPQIKETP